LTVEEGDPVDVPNGPLHVAALVLDEMDESRGIIDVWMTAGRISGMEYSWFDGPMPRWYPDVRLLRAMTPGGWKIEHGEALATGEAESSRLSEERS
jgi:hypothetical protein